MAAVDSPVQEAPKPFEPQAGVGLPLAIAAFGFSVLMLGMASARWFTPDAVAIFVPVALGTGALGLLLGGIAEYRANSVFGGTFCLLYACFLVSTGLILRYWAPIISDAAGAGGFGDAFGTWLLLWCAFTVMLSWGAYYINMPAFLAFTLLALAYLLLGFANIVGPDDPADLLTRLGGYVLIADGLVAWYLAWALAVNELIGNRLPLWGYPYAREEAPATVSPPSNVIPA